MNKFNKYIKSLIKRVEYSQYIRFNTTRQNIFLLLVAVTLVTISFDLSSELAKEKGEIDAVIAVMENSNEESIFYELPVFAVRLPETGFLPSYSVPIEINDVINFPKDRSPPPL